MLQGSVTQPITPETPPWLRDTINKNQADANADFDTDLRPRWVMQAAEWVDNNVRQRERGLPYETEFKIPKPKRIVFYDTGMFYAAQGQVEDPTLLDVVLPPPVPVKPPGVLVAGGDACDAAMFQQLATILADLAKLKKFFNVA